MGLKFFNVNAALLLILVWTGNLAYAVPAFFGAAPDNSQEILFSAINQAQTSLLINVYQLENPVIAEQLIGKINSGVCVKIMVEGSPVGGFSPKSWEAVQSIRQAMVDHQISAPPQKRRKTGPQSSQTQSSQGAKEDGFQCVSHSFYLFPPKGETSDNFRRYRFNHAKYLVVDGQTSMISSENFSGNGHPPKGSIGSRGWSVLIHDSKLAKDLTDIFRADSDDSQGDVIDLVTNFDWKPKLPQNESDSSTDPSTPLEAIEPAVDPRRTLTSFEIGQGDIKVLDVHTSPGSLKRMVELVRSAKESLNIQFLSLNKTFPMPDKHESPLVAEIIRAARRGVRVRVLLNDDRSFAALQLAKKAKEKKDANDQDSPRKKSKPRTYTNKETAFYLKSVAEAEHLPLEAKIAHLKALELTYVHNKGMLIDNDRVLISSINGSQNSMLNNREVSVHLESAEANRYYQQIFELDWELSPPLSVKSWYEISPFKE